MKATDDNIKGHSVLYKSVRQDCFTCKDALQEVPVCGLFVLLMVSMALDSADTDLSDSLTNIVLI